jgi:hypothetical protein
VVAAGLTQRVNALLGCPRDARRVGRRYGLLLASPCTFAATNHAALPPIAMPAGCGDGYAASS